MTPETKLKETKPRSRDDEIAAANLSVCIVLELVCLLEIRDWEWDSSLHDFLSVAMETLALLPFGSWRFST